MMDLQEVNKFKGLVHDRTVLENLLMSFRIKNANEKAMELINENDNVAEITNLDLRKYGGEMKKIGYALNSYVKALEFIKTYYK